MHLLHYCVHAHITQPDANLTIYNLTSVCARTQEEWKQADQLCDRILGGSGGVDWGLLLQPYPFFTAFKNYIQVLGFTNASGQLCFGMFGSLPRIAAATPLFS